MDNDISEDLSHVPFEELLNIKEKLGTKVYRQTVLKPLKIIHSSGIDDKNENNQQPKTKITIKKRKNNLSEPIEVSSKRLDYRFYSNNDKQIKTFRDPRFDEQCGQFRSDKFEQNYNFLTDMKRKELDDLRRRLKKAKNVEIKEKIRFLMQRITNQIHADEERERTKRIRQKLARTKQFDVTEQTNESNNDRSLKRKFVNKSQIKRTKLLEKYKLLKESGRLQKYMERKRKKLAAKDRKRMPTIV
ncbi:ribosomal RNA processing protein 36 homolog [Dermatophagoides farinae]|uniref:ribosomal RNA processing protein 36 homolog n=1 Tax=Dermatophagoides farinae TaxID=6954 RepID=UPI003F5F5217